MVSRIREAYDETGETKASIPLRLARTGKLVTSAALVLMFAFFVLSTSPGRDIKRDRAGGRDHLRRDRDPRPARPVDHGGSRTLELVAAAPARSSPARAPAPCSRHRKPSSM